MDNHSVTKDFKFLALGEKIMVSQGAHPLGEGWESASFDGSHIISAEIFEKGSLVKDKKDAIDHALKFHVVTASTEGPQLLRWSVPQFEMKIEGRWILSFYARVKDGLLDIRSSIYQSLDQSGSKTVHHMSSHLVSREWKKFISIVQLSDEVISEKPLPLAIFFFFPKMSVFCLELAEVEIRKESHADIMRKHLVTHQGHLCKFLGQPSLYMASAIALALYRAGKIFLNFIGYFVKILSEILYRILLWFSIRYKIPKHFTVYDKSFWTFDKELGFNYTPENKIIQLEIEDGNVTACGYHYVNQLGNVGHDDGRTYDQAKLKILTFGDSFTVGTGGPIGGPTWPDLLRKNLSQAIHSEVSVLNFGRDGTGLLNMFDIAAAKVLEWKPHLIIVAFVPMDLNRGRFWRTVNVVDGFERVLVTAEANPNPNPEQCADAIMINSKMTTEWLESRLQKTLKPDSVIRNIHRQYRYLQRKAHQHVNFFDWKRSFLVTKWRQNDPFHGLTPKYTNCPHYTKSSYLEDKKTVQNIQTIKSTGIPMLLVHLPQYEELCFQTDYSGNSLYRSLEPLTGMKPLKLKEFYSETYGPIKDLYRWPHNDWHYSEAGLKFTADSLSEILLKALPSSLKS